MRECIVYKPIGVIRSGHTKPEETPIQPVYAEGCEGQVEVFPEFAAGLCDVEGFSHIYLVYHLHKADRSRLTVNRIRRSRLPPCRPTGGPIGRAGRVGGEQGGPQQGDCQRA